MQGAEDNSRKRPASGVPEFGRRRETSSGNVSGTLSVGDHLFYCARLAHRQGDHTNRNEPTREALQLAVELSPTPMMLVNSAGTIVHANAPLAQLGGWSHAELIGRSVDSLVPERMRTRHAGLRAEFGAAPSPRLMGVGRELLLRRRDGSDAPVEIGLNPVRTRDESFVLASLVDLRPRRTAERRFEAAVNSSPSGMIMVDRAGAIVLVNREAARLFGYETEELAGRSIELLVPIRSRERHPEWRDGFARDPRSRPMGHGRELYGRRKDGTEVPVEIGLNPVEVEDGVFVLASIVDLTAKRAAERELSESRERFQLIVEGVTDYAIVMLDSGGHIASWNAGAERITGWTADEAIDRHVDLFATPEDSAAGLWREALRIAARDGRYEDETARSRRDGSRFVGHALLTPLADEGARVRGYALLLRDVTERRRLEEHLRQRQKLEAVGTLAGGVAHDFNNILAAVMSYAESLQRSLAGDDARAAEAREIARAAGRGRDLVQQLLDFSRPRARALEARPLGPSVEEAVRFLRSTLPSTIDLVVTIAPDTPAVFVDATQVQQIVTNLATNAAHAMKSNGRIEVATGLVQVDTTISERHPTLERGLHARLCVTDEGPGMPEDVRARVFEPFFTTKPSGEGTGLGLSVVHGIVQGHRGAIEVRSRPGAGTAIEILLPAAPAVTKAEAPAHEAPVAGRGERLLLVDDEPSLGRALAKLLEDYGFSVVFKHSASAALEAFAADPDGFSLVLTDFTMPGTNGLALARELARLRPSLPVLLMSGFPAGLTPESLRDTRVVEVLAKPMTAKELSTAVRRALDGAR